ncbi:MAG: hypothetical protein M0Z88_04265 [Actinomycetota bacterium]|nr:hypothetical protein [Actinomycetota bacterium]
MNKRLLALLGGHTRSLLGRSKQLWLGDAPTAGRHERHSSCPFVDDLGLQSLMRR